MEYIILTNSSARARLRARYYAPVSGSPARDLLALSYAEATSRSVNVARVYPFSLIRALYK